MKVLNVDIESPESKQKKANTLAEKLKAMKATKDAKKEERKKQLAAAKGEQKDEEMKMDLPGAKKGLNRNPQNEALKKLVKEELLKDNPKVQKAKEPIITTKAIQFDKVNPRWHVLSFIQIMYDKKKYGPFIVQMNRHNPKSKTPQIAEYAVIKHLNGEDSGCVVFTFGGPQFLRFSNYNRGVDFPLEDLIYYYNKKSITLDPKDDREKKKLDEERKLIEGYYKSCSIYELQQIETKERDKDLKFRVLYELINKLGR